MAIINVLCPTRGRPEAVKAAIETFRSTATEGVSIFTVVVDRDDPRLDEYRAADFDDFYVVDEGGTMVKALNAAALRYAEEDEILGSVGDDHRFRTPGWDQKVRRALFDSPTGTGFAYGDDLGQGANLPTQVFISSQIIRALGYMALPTCRHLYIDNAWKALGEVTGSLIYLPDVVIEHMHPFYGKAPMDEGHARVNTEEMYSHDGTAFGAWLASGIEKDAEKVRGAMHW